VSSLPLRGPLGPRLGRRRIPAPLVLASGSAQRAARGEYNFDAQVADSSEVPFTASQAQAPHHGRAAELRNAHDDHDDHGCADHHDDDRDRSANHDDDDRSDRCVERDRL
jgi:hypothetical protein